MLTTLYQIFKEMFVPQPITPDFLCLEVTVESTAWSVQDFFAVVSQLIIIYFFIIFFNQPINIYKHFDEVPLNFLFLYNCYHKNTWSATLRVIVGRVRFQLVVTGRLSTQIWEAVTLANLSWYINLSLLLSFKKDQFLKSCR